MKHDNKNLKRFFSSFLVFVCAALICGSTYADVARVRAFLDAAGPDSAGTMIRLKAGDIDTTPEAAAFSRTGSPMSKLSPDVAAAFQSGHDVKMLFLVQCEGPVRNEWRVKTGSGNTRVLGYIPDNALLVEAYISDVPRIAGLKDTRWIGVYKPDYKIQPSITRSLEADDDEGLHVNIVVTVPEYAAFVAAAAVDAGGFVVSAAAGGRRGFVSAVLPPNALNLLASMVEVEWIERYVQPVFLNNAASEAARMNTMIAWTNAMLTGRGQVVAVADTGLDTGDLNNMHPDFSNRIHAAFSVAKDDWSDTMGHGTHCAGSVLGSGAGYNNGEFRGSAWEALLVVQCISDEVNNLVLPDDLQDLFRQAYASDARIHSDSWGMADYGRYSVASAAVDEFVWEHPDMLVVFSAGNAGADSNGSGVIDPGSVGSPATAKNVLSVGAAQNYRPPGSGGYSDMTYRAFGFPANPVADSHVSFPYDGVHQGMAAFSSRGPCLDGRVKPDIVAPGTDVVSCRSRAPGAGVLWGTGSGVLDNVASNLYVFCGGTSMSAPLTAGAAALVRQYYQEKREHTNPSAALIKATLLAGARSLFPGQYGAGDYIEVPAAPRPNNVEGWGHVDIGGTLVTCVTNIFHDAIAIETGDIHTYSFSPGASNSFTVMLVWSDYPSASGASVNLVNDLDLLVFTPSGQVFSGNGVEDGFDRLNNVEGVDVAFAEPGVYSIAVIGGNVPESPQPYALVMNVRSPAANMTVSGLAHMPELVTETNSVQVRLLLKKGAEAIGGATNFYRVDGGAWNSLPMERCSGVSGSAVYSALIPPQALGAEVEYFAKASDFAGDSVVSMTNTFEVRSPVIYISHAGSQTEPYNSWATAFTSITGALDYALKGQELLVAEGVYREGLISINKEVALRASPENHAAVIDGHGSNACLEIVSAFVEGFAIVNGMTTNSGAGVKMLSGSLVNCLVMSNSASEYGGGIYAGDGAVISNCLVFGNTASMGGGIMFFMGGTIVDSAIANNTAESGGGIIQFAGSIVENCLIANNTADDNGGGVLGMLAGRLERCIITENSAGDEGGGVAAVTMFPGAYTIGNSLIIGNTASDGGGMMIPGGCVVVSCTVADNTAESAGGIFMSDEAVAFNSIFWGNAPDNYVFSNEVAWAFNCSYPALPEDTDYGQGNISLDPLFVNPAAGNYRLSGLSPCRDIGFNMPWMIDSLDLDGNPRLVNMRVDMGAYEREMGETVLVFASAGPNGAIEPSGVVTSSLGGRLTFQMTPDENSSLRQLRVNGVSVGRPSSYTTGPITNQATVEAFFAIERAVRNDYSGDGRSDIALFDTLTGEWYIHSPVSGSNVVYGFQWGWPGAVVVPGDYNGDGIADLAVFDSGSGRWFVYSTVAGVMAWNYPWGMPGAVPVPGDYNGDGACDMAVYLPSSGEWFVISPSTGEMLAWAFEWGAPGLTPVSGDYSGDSVSDANLLDIAHGNWFTRAMSGEVLQWSLQWGWPGATAVPGDYNGDGKTDFAVFDNFSGLWFALNSSGQVVMWAEQWGYPGVIPVSGDYNGDGIDDLAVYDPATGAWFIRSVDGGLIAWDYQFGAPGMVPVGVSVGQ